MIFELLKVNDLFTVTDTWGRSEFSPDTTYIKTAKHFAVAAVRVQGRWCAPLGSVSFRVSDGHPVHRATQ